MGKNITKEDIIRALLDVSFFHSAGATSMADIAEEVGIKKASLYNHFASREEMVARTFSYCADYFKPLTFIPSNMAGVAQKYPTETILKGIANRYFKMHEKDPLFQIYTFVESQKYFSKEARAIIEARDAKLIDQLTQVAEALAAVGKLSLPAERLRPTAVWFCRAINDMLNIHLQERKQLILQNPKSGAGELFSLPVDNSTFERVNLLVDSFALLIR